MNVFRTYTLLMSMLVPLLALVAEAGPVSAQDGSQHVLEIEPVVGDGFFLASLTGRIQGTASDGTSIMVDVNRRPGFVLGVRLRGRISSFLSLQLSYARVSTRAYTEVEDAPGVRVSLGSNMRYVQAGLRGALPFGTRHVRPFLEAGFGGVDGLANGSNSLRSWHVGAGVRFKTDGPADVVLGARDYMWMSRFASAAGVPDRLQHDLLLTTGLIVGFF